MGVTVKDALAVVVTDAEKLAVTESVGEVEADPVLEGVSEAVPEAEPVGDTVAVVDGVVE